MFRKISYNGNSDTLEDEAFNSAEEVGYSTVNQPGSVDINSFLTDRPPIIEEPPEEPAEIRWGDRSDFQYDDSGSNVSDYYVQDAEIDGTMWRRSSYGYVPPGDLDADGEDDDVAAYPEVPSLVFDVQEVARETEVVRVTGTGDAYVDIERIINVTFEMPTREGPTGLIREFYRFNMNWGV